MQRNLTVGLFLGLAAMLFMAGAAAAQTPSKPQIITEKTALRSDVIDRFIAAQLQVATVLSGMGKGDSKADADAMPKLSAAVDQLTSVKTELKKDSFEDSQELQALLKQKYSALVDASARSHAQVTRVRSVIKNNKDLLALLNNI